MRNVILQHNIFLQNMAIVPIVNIAKNEKDNVKKLFKSSSYLSRFEPTKKASEGMYLLVSNKGVLNKAQNEVYNLLHIFVANVKQLLIKNKNGCIQVPPKDHW